MATYYISPHGSNSNNGLGPDPGHASNKPWLTIAKALGTVGMSSGDTAYVAPGVYRENLSPTLTNPTAETKIVGDYTNAQGFKDGSGNFIAGGVIRLSGYTTNDKTTPSATTLLALSGIDFLTFENFVLNPAPGANMVTTVGGSTNITFRNFVITPHLGAQQLFNITGIVDTALNWLFENGVICRTSANGISISLPTSTVADYDANVQFRNILVYGGNGGFVAVTASGANAFKGGGVDLWNITQIGGVSPCLATNSANVSTSIPCTIYNCFAYMQGGTFVEANTSGQILEDYNLIQATTARSNVSAGSNSVANTSHAYLFDSLASWLFGMQPRPMYAPTLDSPLLGFGNQASGPTTDILGRPRPSGPSPTWSNVLNAIGCFERGNTAVKETSTVRTGSNAIKILGPGVHDFDVPVDAVSTTLGVYTRFNSSYTGTKPQLKVLNGIESGVSDATDTATGSADTWEELSLNFTPTRSGVVTVRFQSNSTAAAGATFWDDFSVT